MSQPSVGGQNSGRTGQMTAVMRAIQTQNGPLHNFLHFQMIYLN